LISALAALVVALPLSLQVAAEGSATSSAEVLTPTQIVRVPTPTLSDRNRLATLGLDLAGTVGRRYIDVIVESAGDRASLKRAGFTWTVLVEDVDAAERERIRADKAYAASKPGGSALPSGRTSYRTLADYDAELATLAATYPTQVRPLTLNHLSLEGRAIHGIEVANGVNADDGRPTFLVMGVHHAREWPSSEVTMEFAYDLLQNAGVSRIQNILDNARVVFVPVVNPDGFEVSRSGAYELKRKNCRIVDGQLPAEGACALRDNRPFGTDPNRNYGAKWGGPGASTFLDSQIYRGAGPFSEPETQNIQELISERQVVTLISNHTYSALVLRPPGTSVDGLAYDEVLMKSIGDAMAAEMGYDSIYGWQLYDTTGTTEDWSYAATAGLGFTFELGTNGFHPRFATIVPLYTGGTKKIPNGGVREALLIAAESTIDNARHSVIQGTAPAGATLRLTKSFLTSTWDGTTFSDTLDDTMVVPASGSWTWHVNPSTRPAVSGAGGTEAWTLTCGSQTLPVTVGRGGAVDVGSLTC
jgi:carboxypeptidase T